MAYQALYRQWRPKDFSGMVGQEPIVETLRHQVQTGRIAHAYLFCGSRGTGKTSAAKILARAVNCQNPRNGDPCGECETCRRMAAEDYLDILEFDAASNSRVEDARELLEKAVFPPQFGAYKVYIIDEVHMLSASAFNALLKTLEEPPEYLIFILATTEPYKLPATILSRCQRFDFGRIPAAQIQGRLREAVQASGGEATDGALMSIARAAEGGMRDALSILDMCLGYGRKIDEALVRQVLGTSDRAFLFRFSRALADENAAESIRLVDEMFSSGKDPQVFSRDVSAHLRALVLARCCGSELTEIMGLTEEDAGEYVRESERIPISRLMDMLDRFLHLETELRYSGSPRVALENVSLKCCLRTSEPDTLALNDRMAELENRISALQDQLGTLQDRIAEGIPVRTEPPAEGEPAAERKKPESAVKPVQREKAAAKAAPAEKAKVPMGRPADEIWKEALKQLQKTEPGIHGMFRLGEYIGSDGKEFRWRANPSYEFVATSLNLPERIKRIEEALTAAAGSPCTFIAMDLTAEKQKKAEASDESYIRELKEVFGEEPVSVIDELPQQ
ncbi:MAG: DNA polymerase III subunit gamma/tau [Clostridiales bacterium]|nr:DNA polymerase III subunit gamma/tau [Clostridiales bacterium]